MDIFLKRGIHLSPRYTPLMIAHRGGTGLWPENTLEAFRRAIDLGIDGIELDVHLSGDGVLVVHHDETLKPAIARDHKGQWLTPPTPRIKDLTFEDLQTYDVGRLRPDSRYGVRFPEQTAIDGARIPSLDATIELLKARAPESFRLYVELKTALLDPETGADPRKLAQMTARCVQSHGFETQTTFVSFEWKALQSMKEYLPDSERRFITFPFMMIDPNHEAAALDKPGSTTIRLRALSREGGPWAAGIDWRTQPGESFGAKILHSIKAAGGEGWFAYFRDVTAEMLMLADDLGLKVSVWTVDQPEEMERLAGLGVEAILTDRPDRLKQLFENR